MRCESHVVLEICADIPAMCCEPEIQENKCLHGTLGNAVCGVLLLLSLWPSTPVSAAIFACPSANGDAVIYQDRPCPVAQPVATAKATVRQLPLGIHKSWFVMPEQADERAFCDRRGCECGRIERKHRGGLARAVADALYLDGSWQRYESAYQQWFDSPSTSTGGYLKREDMQNAACEIMMSQQLLRTFADSVIAELQKQVRLAREKGFDNPEPCERGEDQACALFQSVELYRQLVIDAQVLSHSRGALQASIE